MASLWLPCQAMGLCSMHCCVSIQLKQGTGNEINKLDALVPTYKIEKVVLNMTDPFPWSPSLETKM